MELVNTVSTKYCKKGNHYLPPTTRYFDRDKHKKDGLHATCKQCRGRSPNSKRRQPKGEVKIVNVKVNYKVKEGLDYISKAYGVSQSVIVEEALKAYLVTNLTKATRYKNTRRAV